MIRVLLVDDSPIALHILQRLLLAATDMQVVGTAANGKEALDLLPSLNPDVICTDLHMPIMNGLELTQAVMSTQPRPILVVSVSVEPGSPNIFKLLEAGALDVYPKPHAILDADQEKLSRELASKIRIIAGVHVFRYPSPTSRIIRHQVSPPPIPTSNAPVKIVAIGASTGGPQGLRAILAGLPSNFPSPVVCVQHIGADFLSELVRWLAGICALPVRKASHGTMPENGVVYFAPEDTHLEFDLGGRFILSDAVPCDGHRPSATITLSSAARCYGPNTTGVLLSGMGRDGADGMAKIAAAGGVTIAQDEASCVVYGMPQAAVALGAVRHVLPLEQIAPALVALVNGRKGVGKSSGTKEST